MDDLFEEFGIPKTYLTHTKDNQFLALVHKLWLKSLVKHLKLVDFIEHRGNSDAPPANWTKITIRVLKKRDCKVMPLPRVRQGAADDAPLFFSQLLQYISTQNYKNLWKEAYKKYNSKLHQPCEASKDSKVVLEHYNDVLRATILRIYGCPIVNVCDPSKTMEESAPFPLNLNILPAVCCVETLNALFLVHAPHLDHNLSDCVTFSPAIFDRCHTKPLFIVYQLLQTLKSLHSNSLTLGDVTLSDIFLTEDMWIYVLPTVTSNIHIQEQSAEKKPSDCRKLGHKFDSSQKCQVCGHKTYDKVETSDCLMTLCQHWVEGKISNFTYISALNKLAGRKLGDPNCHHVFPWVTDFASRCGKNWRDLKKSKYRLNKGDCQLDLTFDSGHQNQVPHHVSDVLSSITYYVYMARRTPKQTLCKHVRTNWVPAEYPSSIQRLQEWTPDECIPEFFTDPSVFRSIHDDLEDLEVPQWCSGPEEFIERHREALESAQVSEKLHHWIDLTFGYKLAGPAAVKAKNVCLNLVDEHGELTKSGVVQLFTCPHPAKAATSVFWGKVPPKVYSISRARSKNGRDRSQSPAVQGNRSDEDGETFDKLTLSKFLSRSRSSLNEEPSTSLSVKSVTGKSVRSTSVGPKVPTFTSHVKNSKNFGLPREFKPDLALDLLEKKHLFFTKAFHSNTLNNLQRKIESPAEKQSGDDAIFVQNSFTNLIFTKNFDLVSNSKNHNCVAQESTSINCNYADIISNRRICELQILGCLILELFMAKHLRALGNSNQTFQQRLISNLTVLQTCRQQIPKCVLYVVELLLKPGLDNFDNFKYAVVSDIGLPPPSAHQFLEPLLRIIPFPVAFPALYSLLSKLKEFESVARDLNILYYFDCDGERCTEYEHLERTKILFEQNIGECSVKMCVLKLEEFLDNLNPNTDMEIVNIVLPHVRQLIENPPTAVLAAWYLFDPVARVLGQENTVKSLLEPILKLYENEPSELSLPYNGKIAKLYHHSFLLRLIVRFGLKCFLDNFIAPLVEAVGRYKDYEKVDFILHTHSDKKNYKKTSHLKTMDAEEVSADFEVRKPQSKEPAQYEPEMFEFDEDKVLEQLEMNAAEDMLQGGAEEALDATLSENLDQLRSLEELKINLNEEEMLSSPTIPIPTSKLHAELTNISCDVGSKKSECSFSSTMQEQSPLDVLKRNTSEQNVKISDMSADSIVWLGHRLGPVLTARYLSRNLLKMLTLCYVSKENLMPLKESALETISVTDGSVVGDQNASKVLECLSSIAGLYGEQLILFQYIPHMSELIALCKRKLTANLEGGLISCLALLQHVIPYLSDATLMDHLQDVILKNILHPIVRLLASTKCTFPSGAHARNIVARKYVDVLYVLSVRIGSDMTRTHLAVPSLQRFFLIFDKVHGGAGDNVEEEVQNKAKTDPSSHYIEVGRDGTITEWAVSGGQVSNLSQQVVSHSPQDELSLRLGLEELKQVFTVDLAHCSYVPFLKLLGTNSLEISLNNHALIRDLCKQYQNDGKQVTKSEEIDIRTTPTSTIAPSSSIGSNIALIGNRIDVQSDDGGTNASGSSCDLLNLVSNRMENNSRHLRGNWLAYWEHEIGRSDKDTMFNFKQIKLQQFAGHLHSVKCLHVLDNENSFMSGSRDKTVKLWSLRSHGDGQSVSPCQWTYTAHKKSVLSITFIESKRLVASCDSIVHIWDPFMGANVGNLENVKYAPVNVLKSLPAPSNLFLAATTEGSVKMVDARQLAYVYELKVSLNPSGLIRCLAVAPSGLWCATGQSSGTITVLDCRTGLVLASWRAHEGEVLQLVAFDNGTLISTSLDQMISVWNANDGRFMFHLRGATEPVHCLNIYNRSELISGTTANRIGVHTSVDLEASFSSTKLRSDAFKGLLTSMALLPLNRLLLLGSDTGAINLLC